MEHKELQSVSINVHHARVDRIDRLENCNGTMAVKLGNGSYASSVTLMLDDDALRQLIVDLTAKHRALLDAEYVDATEGGPNAVAQLASDAYDRLVSQPEPNADAAEVAP